MPMGQVNKEAEDGINDPEWAETALARSESSSTVPLHH